MSTPDIETIEACQDTLMECLLMLMKAGNRSTDKNEILELQQARQKINRQLDRIESAQLNTALMSQQIRDAMEQLTDLTQTIKKETNKIKKIGEKIQKADRYVGIAAQVIRSVSALLV